LKEALKMTEKDPERHYQVKLETKLKEMGIWYKFIEKSTSTVHTADAASVTGIELHRISKNLMAQTNDGRYAALIIPGDMRLNYKEAARILEAKNINLVPFNEAHTISGYPPGGTPSLGYEKQVVVVLDTELMPYETFYCGGGSTKMLLELKKEDVIKINKARIHKISIPAETQK
jgi:Cys-tRNA(Pro)/Cys-tRNA(Cys) deacylase